MISTDIPIPLRTIYNYIGDTGSTIDVESGVVCIPMLFERRSMVSYVIHLARLLNKIEFIQQQLDLASHIDARIQSIPHEDLIHERFVTLTPDHIRFLIVEKQDLADDLILSISRIVKNDGNGITLHKIFTVFDNNQSLILEWNRERLKSSAGWGVIQYNERLTQFNDIHHQLFSCDNTIIIQKYF